MSPRYARRAIDTRAAGTSHPVLSRWLVPVARVSIARPGQAGPASAAQAVEVRISCVPIIRTPINSFTTLDLIRAYSEENRTASRLLTSERMTRLDLAAIDPLTSKIIGCGVEVHRQLGPGLLESVYHVCLGFELRNAGLTVVENLSVPVLYKDLRFVCALKADFLVNDTVIVEIKSVVEIAPVHEAQLVTYLRLSNRPVGLLMNFNVAVLKEGIRRKLNAKIKNSEFSVPPSL